MDNLALRGARVLDFGRAVGVPFATQVLGWLGAEVILVENMSFMTNRTLPPFAQAVAGVNRSGIFNLMNSGKLSVTLDVRTAEGKKIARELAAISDVVTENLPYGAMEKAGLGYDDVRKINPSIVYLSLSAFGRSGPMKDAVSFHSGVAFASGLAAVTGYPNGHPRMAGSVLPDFVGASYGALALLEALYHRAQTGQGQYVEVSMSEAQTAVLPEAIADYSLNRIEPRRVGNRHKTKAPHNVYPSRGELKWVAVSVETDQEWRRLCAAIKRPEWLADPRFSTKARRHKNQGALDDLIASWTRDRDAEAVAALLQGNSVAAFPVFDSGELLRDPHLIERGFVTSVQHAEAGIRPMGTTAWMIDNQRPPDIMPAPLLGEHNEYVLQELLSIPGNDFQALAKARTPGTFGLMGH